MSTESQEKDSLVKRLLPIASPHNRGKRAALRHYWSEATRSHAFPILGQVGALGDARKTILAALFAINPNHQAGVSVGTAARRIDTTKSEDHPYERHFNRLLANDTLAELAQGLYRLNKRLERQQIGLDYNLLNQHLHFWNQDSDSIKTDWAKHFWQPYLANDPTKKEVEK